MKVQCSKCKSSYNISDEKVPAAGANIKCPKCQNIIAVKKIEMTSPPIQNSTGNEPVNTNQGQPTSVAPAEKVPCPYCAEEILSVATKCKHCGSDIVDKPVKTNTGEKTMVIRKERSYVPMILGIIGGVIGLPGALCAGACAVGVGALAGESDATVQAMGDFYLFLGIITTLAGLIFGCLARRKPVLSGSIMIICAILGGITIVVGNMFAIVASILFLIGGGIAIANKNRPITSPA